MVYPLRFDTIYIEKPWGGRRLEAFKGSLPDGDIGETWDVSAQDQGVSTVKNGRWAGRMLTDVIARTGREVLGTRPPGSEFPLMVRYVSSRENLSIQLHPTAAYARKKGMRSGKDEAWYVLDAEDGAFVYAGLRTCTVEEFRRAAEDGTLPDLVVRRPVQKGDFVLIPAGTVHAICAGITLIEFCENSNTTYRLFDYGRPRGLDLLDGFEVVDVDAQVSVTHGLTWQQDGYDLTHLCLTERFAVNRIDVRREFQGELDGASFQILTCIAGSARLEHDGGVDTLVSGESVLLPAALGTYRLTGEATVLESHVPDVHSEGAAITARLR